jgi:hypothetical protein
MEYFELPVASFDQSWFIPMFCSNFSGHCIGALKSSEEEEPHSNRNHGCLLK